MKLQSLFVLALVFSVFACNNAPEGAQLEAGEAEEITSEGVGQTFTVNTAASVINWVGTKPVGDRHEGTVKIKSGNLMHDGQMITGGNFVIDLTTINDTDMPAGEYKTKLENHLKSEDFFSVGQYPTAEFTIAKVTPTNSDSTANYVITGNLMMKDSVKSIQIPAMINMDGGKLMATTPSFTIDRTKWNVMYLSGAIGALKDEMISDQIGLQINLVAEPNQATEELQ